MNVPDLDTEAYYTMRDEFVRYVENEVNPARCNAGLTELRIKESEECFRILYEFWKNFEKKF